MRLYCGPGATLFSVASAVFARDTRQTNVEIISLRLFNQADEAGELITRRYVESRLTELRSHPHGCRCAGLCGLARKVNSASVFRCAAAWQRQINITRKLAGVDPVTQVPPDGFATALDGVALQRRAHQLPEVHSGRDQVVAQLNIGVTARLRHWPRATGSSPHCGAASIPLWVAGRWR
jgi:hypothetical protein